MDLTQKGGEIQVNITAAYDRSGLLRCPGFTCKETAITADPVIGNKTKKEEHNYG